MHPTCSGRRPPRNPPRQSAADSRFRKYKPEEARAVRMPKVKEDAKLRALKAAWSKFWSYPKPKGETTLGTYQRILKALEGIGYSAKDVEKFSVVLTEFQNEQFFAFRAGMFLSALINNGQDDDYIICTKHLDQLPNYLGCMNQKNITVIGDLGIHVGDNMEKGTIIVKGNAGNGVGANMEGGKITIHGDTTGSVGHQMKGGEIIVQGNTGWHCGHYMEGGTITVKGNAGSNVGQLMSGGEIHIQGDYGSTGTRIKGGKIFHKGVRIYPKTD